MSAKTVAKPATGPASGGFTAEEKAAMQARAQELKAEARASKSRAEGLKTLRAAVAAMKEPDRGLAERLHDLVTAAAPQLLPKTWYGMPAYTNADGKVICFFQAAGKFNTRYATFGFQHDANLDDGNLWPTAFAVINLTPAEETKIRDLVSRAATPPSAKTT